MGPVPQILLSHPLREEMEKHLRREERRQPQPTKKQRQQELPPDADADTFCAAGVATASASAGFFSQSSEALSDVGLASSLGSNITPFS